VTVDEQERRDQAAAAANGGQRHTLQITTEGQW